VCVQSPQNLMVTQFIEVILLRYGSFNDTERRVNCCALRFIFARQ
jgi:hypothetical protein